MEGVKLASKIERVVEHIARLEPGDKVSVRGLAQELGVSEGTAYKSIKAAEAQGLVITRPKAGTVRINIRGVTEHGDTTLAEAARSVGAVCLCGTEAAARKPLPSLVVADGNAAHLLDTIRRCSGTVLCLMGDRPELHGVAVEAGVDILLTGGAEMLEGLLETAERLGLSVFASEQDSVTLIGMLNRRMPEGLPKREMTTVRDWMQLPRYLYHDDMVTEWHRLYSDIYYDSSSVAVVDDSLKICGSVDTMTAMAVPQGIRMSEIMDEPEAEGVVDEELGMDELADRLIKSRRQFAAVTSRDGMSGFISLGDVVRYYQYNQTYRQFERYDDSVLQLNSDEPGAESRFYTAQIKASRGDTNRSTYVNLICSAAAWHAYDLLGRAVNFDNGTFYAPSPLTEPGEYTISSEVMKRTEQSLVLELEMFDNMRSYLKSTLTVSTVQEKQ